MPPNWLWDRAQGFQDDGVVLKRYHTNGALDHRYGTHYQPDQAGAMLWSLDHITQTEGYDDRLVDRTMRQLANGLACRWQGDRFGVPTQDLWEDTKTRPQDGDSFTYTLAACAHGLARAVNRWSIKLESETSRWTEAASGMRSVLADVPPDGFHRKKIYQPYQGDPSNVLDASQLGLAYPFADPAELSAPSSPIPANSAGDWQAADAPRRPYP